MVVVPSWLLVTLLLLVVLVLGVAAGGAAARLDTDTVAGCLSSSLLRHATTICGRVLLVACGLQGEAVCSLGHGLLLEVSLDGGHRPVICMVIYVVKCTVCLAGVPMCQMGGWSDVFARLPLLRCCLTAAMLNLLFCPTKHNRCTQIRLFPVSSNPHLVRNLRRA